MRTKFEVMILLLGRARLGDWNHQKSVREIFRKANISRSLTYILNLTGIGTPCCPIASLNDALQSGFINTTYRKD